MREKFSRFAIYMKYKGLNDNKVTVECGLSQGLLNQARRGDSDLGRKTIDKILNTYQDLSRVWLLTGEGKMLQEASSQSIVGNNNTQLGNNNNISERTKSPEKIVLLESKIASLMTKLEEKDTLIGMLKSQIEAKDTQINTLLSIISNIKK